MLLVDDDPSRRRALEEVLAPLDQNVVCARSGREALRLLLSQDFAVVLLDIRMPGMDGYETAELIRQRSQSERTPIIFITSYAPTETDVARGYALGAVDYLFCPLVAEIVRAKVAVFVDLHRKTEEVREQAERLRRTQAELTHQALHDPLTDLPNRALFVDRLEHALLRRASRPSSVAVFFLDLDRFKLVNDSLGHAAGDRVLVALAERLRETLRPGDTIARFGGDEFIVLCEDVTAERELTCIAERIAAALDAPFDLDGAQAVLTVSTGIAVSTTAHEPPETLIRNADAAMYRAKERGGARWLLFDDAIHRRAVERLEMESALRLAVERGEFRLLYHPMVDTDTGAVTGFEALVRWNHPTLGTVAPGRFIGLAEQTGLIEPLGAWVLAEALRQAQAWRTTSAGSRLTMCVNVSARQLARAELAEQVAGLLADTGNDPNDICLEITESAVIEDVATTLQSLRSIRALGVRLGIDDYGAGYTSLANLKAFPIDTIKIDRSVIAGLGTDRDDAAIVMAIVRLAHALELDCVAEGVESEEQLALLRTLGCDAVQGFLFGEPQSAEAITAWLWHGGVGVGSRPAPAWAGLEVV
ncbi:MAG TPA: EAL domain-containing protein [Candidatus Dormibacteraeota bacterium]|nr:EAL domain-containing protein [Candidatus Dormibacteraeota bacterium]